MPLVCKPSAFTCRAERLARATASPHGSITRPSGKVQGVGPSADAGEEVALSVSVQVFWGDILDTPFIHVARRDMAGFNQVSQPLRRVRIYFVVVGGHVAPRFGVTRRIWVLSGVCPANTC